MTMEFFEEIEVNDDQAQAIARGLFTVARADGDVHPQETALIAEFFASTTDSPADLAALGRSSDLDGSILAGLLSTEKLRQLFVKTALLLAYTDGEFSDGEAKKIAEYAKALGIDDEHYELLKTQVREFLMLQLSHLSNVEAAATVAKELDL